MYSREIEIERVEVDAESGEIKSLPVFTGGEASDGNMLNLAGVKTSADVG